MGQLVVVEIYGYLRHLHSDNAHLSDTRYESERVLNGLHIVVELTVGLVLALKGDKLGAYITEIVLHLNGKDADRQMGCLESLNAMLELRPELVVVLKVLIELDDNDAHSVTRVGIGLFLEYFLVGEYIVLERFRYFLLDFL